MISSKLYREYRMKSYLNMNHFIMINGNPGQTHPHTWEFVFVIIVAGDEFVEFRTFENLIDGFMDKYQNRILNEIDPFDRINPTIENVTDYFSDEIRKLLKDNGGQLVSIEGSETPTRSYIVSLRNEPAFVENLGRLQDERRKQTIDSIVENIKNDTL